MEPLTKKCREIVKSKNTAADQNKLENNYVVPKRMVSKVCPMCKVFTFSSLMALNAHIKKCLSSKSISRCTSDPKLTKSKIKPERMRSMVEIYKTAQHCTIEELERRNGINLAERSSLPAQDIELGSEDKKRKSPVNFEEIESEGDVYVDANGTKLRILSKSIDLSPGVMESGETGTRTHVDGDKRSKISFSKKKKRKLQEKHLLKSVSDSKKFCSPRDLQNLQITGMQEHTNGPEEHLQVEEAFAKPRRAHGLVKYIEPESVFLRACSKQSIMTRLNDKGDHLHPTLTRKKELAGVNNASQRSSEPHYDHKKVYSLRSNVRVPFRLNNPVGEVKKNDSKESDSSFECKDKDELKNKSKHNASLSIQKNKLRRALTRNDSSVIVNSKPFPDGHDLSSKPRGFSSSTKKRSSSLSKPETSAPKFMFGPKCKTLGLKRQRSYYGSESDGEEIVRQSEAKTSDNATTYRRGNSKDFGKGKSLVSDRTSSGGINDSYSDKVTAGAGDEMGSIQNDVGPYEKVVVDEETCDSTFFETSEGLHKSSDVQCHDVASHLDVQSDSRGYMASCDGTSLGTEDARYPVESKLNEGEKMSYIDEDGKSICGQNVHAMTKLLPNDGSDSYDALVDLIPIPAPPGSFLPSPSDDFHGNSTQTSNQDQSSENHREFADRDSSDSPSPTSTISNSDIGKFASSLNGKFPFRYSIQDVIGSSLSDVTDGSMVNKISQDPSTSVAGREGLAPVQPKVDLLYTETAAPSLKNGQLSSCSLKDAAVLSSAVSDYQDADTMPAVPKSLSNKQVNSGETKLPNNCKSLLSLSYSEHKSGELHYSTGDPLQPNSNKACSNSGTRFFFNTDGESASPSTSSRVVRLMGKDIIVVNKDETSYSHQTAKENNLICDASKSSADLATFQIHCNMGAMNDGGASIKPASTASVVSPMNSISMNNCQKETSLSGPLPLAQTGRFQVPPTMGVSPVPIKWNCVAQHYLPQP